MHRRTFVIQSGAAATVITMLPSAAWGRGDRNTVEAGGADEIIKKLSLLNDEKVEGLKGRQIDHPGHQWDGGVADAYEVPNAHTTAGFIRVIGSAYASEFSRYHLAEELIEPLERAVTCLLHVQYEDGTIDLHTTNFHSTPDTAFIINDLGPLYLCLIRLNRPGLENLIEKMDRFFSNAGKCLQVGGIHTPNHRWVVSAALAWVNYILPSHYTGRIDQWLAEGIDQDPDGQYTEKSVGTYSPVCDSMFITMGRLLKRPELFDVVRKNLEMSLYYIQPGGEVVTDASGRQDSAYIRYVDGYYYAYRYFAIADNHPVFAAVCQLIENEMPERITRFLPYLMEDPLFERDGIKASGVPDNYFKRFVHSGIFRIRHGLTDITLIEDNPTFLSFRRGNAVMQSMRLGASFFGRGQFVAEETEVDGEKIVLRRTLTRGYYQPFKPDEIAGDGDWDSMPPRDSRDLSEPQDLNVTVTVEESEGRLTVEAELSGTPHVPVAWEMSFRKGGELTGVQEDTHVEDAFFLEEGWGRYRVGDDVITFGEGSVTHRWTQLRGTEPKQEGLSVYLTGYTPFRHKIFIY